MTTVGLKVKVHALQPTMLSNKGLVRTIKHFSTVVSNVPCSKIRLYMTTDKLKRHIFALALQIKLEEEIILQP